MDIKTRSFYESLEEIPIYNFYKCYKGDLSYIFLDRNGEITEDVEQVWSELLNEYHELTVNNDTIWFYDTILEVKWLENRLIFVPILLDTATKTPINDRKNLFKEIKSWKLPINSLKDVDKCLKALENSKNKLNRKLEEIKDYKEKKKNNNVKETSLQKQAIGIERHLGIKPNIFKDSVVTWISYFDEIKELSAKKSNG